MIIDAISDCHGHYPNDLQGGDLLIVAGDMTARDTIPQWNDFYEWLRAQKYRKKIYIGGNHDNFLTHAISSEDPQYAWVKHIPEMVDNDEENGIYLCDSGTEFEYEEHENHPHSMEGIVNYRKTFKIWGSPWTKTFPGMNPGCKAFTVDADEELAEKWALIPDDTNILITHCPPIGVMDVVKEYPSEKYRNCGSLSLLRKARSIPNLKLFVFGHIHEGYGILTPDGMANTCQKYPEKPPTCKTMPYLVNASHVDENYKPVNKPIRIIL